MAHYFSPSESAHGIQPAQAQPPVHPTPIPEGHEPQDPTILTKLFGEIDRIRNERTDLMRKRYGPQGIIGKEPPRPKYREIMEYENRTEELDKEEAAIGKQINDLLPLMAPGGKTSNDGGLGS